VARVRLGVLFQFKLVSSILRISFSSYLVQSCQTRSIYAILSGVSVWAELASLYYTYSLILYCFLNPSSHLFDYFGISTLSYCSRASHNYFAFIFKISPVIIAFFYSMRCYHSNKAPSSSSQSPVELLLFPFISRISFLVCTSSRKS
jgi:hypothetical protein